MEKKLKQHKSILEQISHLKRRGIIIDDLDKAVSFLSSVNYYRFSGYLFQFRRKESSFYIENLTLSRIIDIYNFDCKFTRLFMYILENVEETLKARFSFTLSSLNPDKPLIYLDSSIYRDAYTLSGFAKLFDKAKNENSDLPFIKHHNQNYAGDLPIWVAVEIMTMGNIHKLYDNLKGKYQKAIAATYTTGSNQLKSWIKNLTYTRNHLAHYMRVYGFNFGRTPVQCNNHPIYSQSGMIFDQLLIAGFMFSNHEDWINYVIPELKALLTSYNKNIELKALGFPTNWEQLLASINTADYSYSYYIREMKTEEIPLLDEFLYQAIYTPATSKKPDRSIIRKPELQIYIENFGNQPHDKAFIAEVDNKVVAAVWVRIMEDYGYIDNNTPSLAISVLEEFRGLGIGTNLLHNMLNYLRVVGYKQISLSVQKENYAYNIYKKAGFKVHRETAEEYVMVCGL